MIFEITIFLIFTILLFYFVIYKYLAVYKGIKILPKGLISELDRVSLWLHNFVSKFYKDIRSVAGKELKMLPLRVTRSTHSLWRKIAKKIDKFFDRIKRNYR